VSRKTNTSKRHRNPKGDMTRRGRWLDAVNSAFEAGRIGRGAMSWALSLSRRSSPTAKPVWGLQTGQAAALRVTDRTIRRYRKELEQAGLVETQHGEIERRPNGTFRRTITNVYKFLVPAREVRKKASSHRPDTGVLPNPSPKGEVETLPRIPVQWADGCHVDDYGPGDRWYYVGVPEHLAPAYA
jgi:hypothetical protein